MPPSGAFDATFDFRSDTPLGNDPDACSPTLRRYHRVMWSEPLPSGALFERMTINGARGCHPLIKDRFDLTLECIRRHYLCDTSPLSAVLDRYADCGFLAVVDG